MLIQLRVSILALACFYALPAFAVDDAPLVVASASVATEPASNSNEPAIITVGETDERPFHPKISKRAGIKVLVPAVPKWTVAEEHNGPLTNLVLQSPELYYPQTVIQIARSSQHGASNELLPDIALSAANTIRKSGGVETLPSSDSLKALSIGDIEGYVDDFGFASKDGDIDMQNIIGRLPSGYLLTVTVVTPVGQMDHVAAMLNKILTNLEELE